MTCQHCKQQFKEGDKVQFTGLSTYHIIEKPRMQNMEYCLERPWACTSIRHLVCGEDD